MILGIVALSFTLESIVEIILLPELTTRWLLVIAAILSTTVILFALSRRGFVRLASIGLVAVMWTLVTTLALTEGGIRTPTIDIAYLIIVIVAGLTLNERVGILTGVICAMSLLALGWLTNFLPASIVNRTPLTIWTADVFYLAIAITLQYLAVHAIRRSLAQAHSELAQRKAVEKRLQQSRDYNEKLIQTANVIVVGLDLVGNITTFNQAAEEITGYSSEEVKGKSWLQILMPWEHFSSIWDQLTHLDRGMLPVSFENPLLTRSGEERWIAWHTGEIRDQGEPEGTICFGVDITDHRALESERMKRQLQLELHRMLNDQVEQERLKIARDLHDGPVQDLVGATFTAQYLLMGDAKNETLRQGLKEIQRVLQEQISSLRGFAGELRSPTLVKFGLEKGMREQLDRLAARHPEISFELSAFQDDPLLPDESRLTLYRVFQEAMNNIIRHARATQVKIRFTKDTARAELVIQDNGVGFAPPPEWMELARRGHLGLVGMRERVETIGGTLEIDTAPGQGTTLRISAPVEARSDGMEGE
jgi:PAS domain S-box-containing protein